MEEPHKEKYCGAQSQHHLQSDLESRKNGDRDVSERRNAKSEHTNKTKQRHDNLQRPRHLKEMLDRFDFDCKKLFSPAEPLLHHNRLLILAEDFPHRGSDFANCSVVLHGIQNRRH